MSVADYCSPVSMNSTHVKLVCISINSNKYFRSMLSNIDQFLHIIRQETLRECRKISQNNNLPIFGDISSASEYVRLTSRNPFWRFFRCVTDLNCLKSRWSQCWQLVSVKNITISKRPGRYESTRSRWLRLNCIRPRQQGCSAFLLRIDGNSSCHHCEVQTMEHILHCNIHRFEGDIFNLRSLPYLIR